MLQKTLLFFVSVVSCSCDKRQSNNCIVNWDMNNNYLPMPPFGRRMRDQFQFNPNYTCLNHGSYGTYPKSVRDYLHALQARSEANADLWMRRDVRKELNKVVAQIAAILNVAAEDIVMIPNATSGMNAVITRSAEYKPGDQILYWSTAYSSVLKILQYIQDTSKGKVNPLQFNVTYPISNDLIVSQFEAFIDTNHSPEKPIRLAIIDHISSVPGVIVPIERIIPMLKQRDILVLIDGAHAIGQLVIDIPKLGPDFYITDCHKWLFSARGSAVLYTDKKHQGTTHAVVIASGYAILSTYQDEFFWTGTMDYSNYLSVSAGLEFIQAVGGENAIRSYTHSLAMAGGQYLAQRFGTVLLQEKDQIGNMVDIRLPLKDHTAPNFTKDFWTDTLLYRFPQVYVPAYKHADQWWIRVSAQIYNDLSDFESLANTILTICSEINANAS